jgi:hypothetical protein
MLFCLVDCYYSRPIEDVKNIFLRCTIENHIILKMVDSPMVILYCYSCDSLSVVDPDTGTDI